MFIRAQNKNSAWYSQRAGRITASVMKSVCVSDPGNPEAPSSMLHRF